MAGIDPDNPATTAHSAEWTYGENRSSSRSTPSATYIQSGLKACYTTTIAVVRNGQIIKTYEPRVIVSTNNKIVITAIPGGGC